MSEQITNHDVLVDALNLGQNAAAAGILVFMPRSTSLFSQKEKERIKLSGPKDTIWVPLEHVSLVSDIFENLCRANGINVRQLSEK